LLLAAVLVARLLAAEAVLVDYLRVMQVLHLGLLTL
jgi:hypothetical protein